MKDEGSDLVLRIPSTVREACLFVLCEVDDDEADDKEHHANERRHRPSQLAGHWRNVQVLPFDVAGLWRL